jgi:predicted nucleotidyltransferase
VPELLHERRSQASTRINELVSELRTAECLCADKACVYITGSFARGEAGSHSDLDLFIVSKGTKQDPQLKKLDDILIKADLIQTTRKLGFPPFSGDGEYLTTHVVSELTGALGKPHDDSSNTFTARLLLLLESKPLLGQLVYQQIIDDVIAAYWKDYPDRKGEFQPAFIANDILRMWRTFCVNYEARTTSVPPEKKAKRKLKNYKLKHSRLLTCYSALLYLLATYVESATVHPDDVRHMVSLSPMERLEHLLGNNRWKSAHTNLEELLSHYEGFLKKTDAPEDDIVQQFLNGTFAPEYLKIDTRFGDLIWEALYKIGQGNQFFRMLVV